MKKIFLLLTLSLTILFLCFALPSLYKGYAEINGHFPQHEKELVQNQAISQKTTANNTEKPLTSMRFVVFADSQGSDKGINAKVFKTCMTSIKKLSPQPSFFVAVGDLVYGSSSSSKTRTELDNFKRNFSKYYPSNIIYPVFGNHEAQSGDKGEKAMADIFYSLRVTALEGYNRSVYYFDKGGSRFFVLNSDHKGSISYLSDTQLKWIKSSLNPKSERNFFFVHEPIFPTGPVSLLVNRTKRNTTWQVIDSAKNPMVFSGHEHFYSRRHIDSYFNEIIDNKSFDFTQSVYQLTVGGFGGDLRAGSLSLRGVDVQPISEHHYAVVDLIGQSVSVKVYSMSGKVLDSFQIK